MKITRKPADVLQLQERDIEILRGLFESRVMTLSHIAELYFDGKKEAAKKRLQKLKAANLLGERARRVYEPSVLYLTRKAFTLLQENGTLAGYPVMSAATLEKRARVSEITLRHELAVMDVKTALCSSIANATAFTVTEFSTWPLLYQFEAARPGYDATDVTVKPDGFIRIQEKESDGGLSEYTFFLEVDRSTETQDTLVSRAGCYLDYYKSGSFAVRNGTNRSDYKEYPFRVLMVFRTAERRNNMAERLLQASAPILSLVCLSTFAEVLSDPLSAVWIRPVDYRDATKGTPFDTDKKPESWGYKRQTAREEFVERTVKKHRVLSDTQ